MDYELPEKLKNLVPYQPLSGNYPVRLDANESFLEPPDWLRKKLADAVSAVAFNRYPDPYCEQLCACFAAFYGIDASLVTAGNGSDELIGLIVSSFVPAGENLVVVSPDFSMYAFYAQMNGSRAISFQKDTDSLALDVDALIQFVRGNNARLVILSNPCNPTSLTLTDAEVLRIVNALDCLVVIDEAYMDFSEGSVLRMAGGCENLLVLKTCSKALGMAAVRLGFAVASPLVTGALRAAKSPYNVNSMTQAVGCVLFKEKDYLYSCIADIKQSRDTLYREIIRLADNKKEILGVAQTAANFVFLRVADAARTAEQLGARGIAVRGMAPYLRISAGSPAENEAVITALSEILNYSSLTFHEDR